MPNVEKGMRQEKVILYQTINQSNNQSTNQPFNRLMERFKADKNATMISSNVNRFISHYNTRQEVKLSLWYILVYGISVCIIILVLLRLRHFAY